MPPRHFVLAACVALGLGGYALAVWLARDTPAGEPAAAPETRQPTVPAPDPHPVRAEQPAPPPPGPAQHLLRMPDGTEVAPLNGVLRPAAIVWGNRPYSPIVGTEHGSGVDWYVHADGTRSTTLDVWRSDLGRTDSVTLVTNPVAEAPLEPGSGAADPRAGGRKQ